MCHTVLCIWGKNTRDCVLFCFFPLSCIRNKQRAIDTLQKLTWINTSIRNECLKKWMLYNEEKNNNIYLSGSQHKRKTKCWSLYERIPLQVLEIVRHFRVIYLICIMWQTDPDWLASQIWSSTIGRDHHLAACVVCTSRSGLLNAKVFW